MVRHLFFCFILSCVFGVAAAQNSQADGVQQLKKEMERLRAEIAALKSEYERRIGVLESRLAEARTSASQSGFKFPAAPAGAVPVPSASPSASSDVTFSSGARTLQALNPEISITGDVTARYSDDTLNPDFNRLNFDGMEMAIQHPLDPYSQAKFFVTFEEGEFDLEEGYVSWESLPGSLGLKVGRFHTNLGKLNRYHKHALPWVDRDLPTQTLFGDEGLIGDGISLNWLPPKLPIAATNEFYFEVINNTNEKAFSGKGFGDPVYIGHLLNYYDVGDNAYFEWGLSAATSHWDLEQKNRSTVYGVDFSYRWQPLRRALYSSFELRSELFYDDRENSPGGSPFGMYVSGEYQLSQRWFTGLRFDFAQSLEDNDQHISSFSPFLTFWESEFVRLRAQYSFLNQNADDNESRFFLQFTWSLGPHKHEAY
ncbi:MAG: hypothetical protein ACE5JX_04760 [Acidobacteriota bacterium]